jgi:hypothetical protein
MMQIDFKTLLYRSLDEELTANEQQLLADELMRNPSLRQEKAELQRFRDRLASYQPSFSNGFSENLLDKVKVGSLAIAPRQLGLIFARTGMLAAAAIAALLMLVYYHDQSLDFNSLLGIADLVPEDFDNLFATY